MTAAKYDLFKRYGLSRTALREAVQTDPAARQEAEDELAICNQIAEDRCHVTRDYAAILREALA